MEKPKENVMDRICWVVGNTHCQDALQEHLDAGGGVEHVVCTLNNPPNGPRFDEVHFLIPILSLDRRDQDSIRDNIFTRLKPNKENEKTLVWFSQWYATGVGKVGS